MHLALASLALASLAVELASIQLDWTVDSLE